MGTGDGSLILFMVNLRGCYLTVIVRTSQYPVQMSLQSGGYAGMSEFAPYD